MSFGRKKIKIPLRKNDLSESKILEYLPRILEEFEVNAREYKHLYQFYKGDQPILRKKRIYNDKADNNIVVENHAFSMVEFKKGYMFGDDVKYSCTNEAIVSDDLSILGKYMKDQKKSTKNVNLAESIYISGVGYRIVLPKDKIPDDLTSKAPFEMYNLENDSTFVVYSSWISQEKLFGGVITEIASSDEKKMYEITIYADDASYVYTYDKEGAKSLTFKSKKTENYGACPIIEYKLNNARIGIVEIVETILNAVNTVSSNSVDNVVDFVNSILVFYNQSVEEEDIAPLLDLGVITIQSNDPTRPGDVKYLVNALQQTDVNVKYESLLKVAYDIVGVPRASTSFTSGGDTGQARLLGGGWSRADVVAKQDEISLKEGEQEMLEIVLHLCHKLSSKTNIDKLQASDIEINFDRTKNDNLLVKTQSLSTLVSESVDMPEQIALKIVGLTADPHEVAKEWAAYREKRRQERTTAEKKVTEPPKIEQLEE